MWTNPPGFDSTPLSRLRRMPNGMRDEGFADATRKPNNSPIPKNSKGHPYGCPFHCSAPRFKTIAKLTPLAHWVITYRCGHFLLRHKRNPDSANIVHGQRRPGLRRFCHRPSGLDRLWLCKNKDFSWLNLLRS